MIELHEVSKSYGGRRALAEVSLSIGPGITGLLGPNGSGKSTLIKAILGLVRIDHGSGTVLGHPWPRERRRLRDLIGYLPEDDCYIAGLQGVEAVQLAARLSGLPRLEAKRRAHEVLDFCDVGQERYRNVETYSTGMRQKLKFAQALVHDPQLLILDEPTTGLDPGQRQELLNRIATLARRHKKAVLLSTHILHDVRQICEHVMILAGGRVRVSDSLARLSQPTAPGLQIRIVGAADALLQRAARDGVQGQRQPDGAYMLPGLTTDDTPRLWQWAAEAETPIDRLEPARASLEEIFIQAVREVAHAHS